MRIVKRLLLGLLVLVGVALLAALFISKDLRTEQEIVINRPGPEVFAYVKMLKNQDAYSKWATLDPAMSKSYRGTDGTVGFVSAWNSQQDDVGQGEQEITAIREGERIDYALRFIRPFESQAQTWMETQELDSAHTRVRWGFSGKMNYPLNLMRVFVDMEGSLGNDFATGLKNLKARLERP